jgi:3-isopropylmalate dehydratase small subunit
MSVWKYGDDINTDMLFPGKYTYTCSTPEEIKPHLLEDLDPNFATNVQQGDFIFAGKNFGCGSSREQPALGLKAVGIAAVVARSFAIDCGEAVGAYQEGDPISLDAVAGTIAVGDTTFSFPKLPERILAIRDAGGLLPYTFRLLETKGKDS